MFPWHLARGFVLKSLSDRSRQVALLAVNSCCAAVGFCLSASLAPWADGFPRCRLASSSCARAGGLWLSLASELTPPGPGFLAAVPASEPALGTVTRAPQPSAGQTSRQVLGAWCPGCMGPGSCGHSVPVVPRPSPARKRGAVSPVPGPCFEGNFWSRYLPGVGPRPPEGAQAWVLQVVCVLGPSLAHGDIPTAACVSSRLPHFLYHISSRRSALRAELSCVAPSPLRQGLLS